MSNHLGVGRHHELHEARVRQEASPAGMRAAGIIFGMSRTLLHRFLYRHHFLVQSSVAMETDVIVLVMFCGKINNLHKHFYCITVKHSINVYLKTVQRFKYAPFIYIFKYLTNMFRNKTLK